MIFSSLALEAPVVSGGTLVSGAGIVIAERKHYVTVAAIQEVVAHYFLIPKAEMQSARRDREVCRPRQIAMFLCREYTPRSFPDIGRRFGDRDHTTVIHAIRQVEKLCIKDPEFAEDVRLLRRAVEKAL